MAKTLLQILTDVNATVDLEASIPTGDELTLRANYANQAIWDAAGVGQLAEFQQEFLIGATGATVSMPANFHELMDDPHVLTSSGIWESYGEIDAQAKYHKSVNDKYCYLLGNPASGYNLIFNGLVSGATLSVIFQRFPSGLATLTDVCELDDPTYVVRKVESYVLYSRGDDRFPTAKSEAATLLQNLYGKEMKTAGGQGRSTKMTFNNPLR
jgi:hypothetical protein